MNEGTINDILVALAEGKNRKDVTARVMQVLQRDGMVQPPQVDPFEGVRTRAIELRDLDGLPTFVTIGTVLQRVENGWIPALTALSDDEARALDHVLRIWEHETRRWLKSLIDNGERSIGLPWQDVVDMSRAQDGYRSRLKLPLHPHGECCTHYIDEGKEVRDAAMVRTARARRHN